MAKDFGNIRFSGKLRPSQVASSSIIRTELESNSKELLIVAPPGSGKTELLVNTIPLWTKNGKDVLVAALTNEQVNDICTRLATKNPDTEIVRFSSSSYEPEYEFPPNVLIIKNICNTK